MMNLNCGGCDNNCCQNPKLTPVLLPSEEKRFKKYSRKVETPYRDIFVLKKKENGGCTFLDNKTKRCKIYNQRPLECRLYPFLLALKKDKVGIKLDRRFCPRLKALTFDRKKLIAFVGRHRFPPDWIKGYKTLEGV